MTSLDRSGMSAGAAFCRRKSPHDPDVCRWTALCHRAPGAERTLSAHADPTPAGRRCPGHAGDGLVLEQPEDESWGDLSSVLGRYGSLEGVRFTVAPRTETFFFGPA
jgi:hypothetical protein